MNNNQTSNNTNGLNKTPDNGGANAPSLSGVNKAETDNRTLAAANSRKGDLGKREIPHSLPNKSAAPSPSRAGVPRTSPSRNGGGLSNQGGMSSGGELSNRGSSGANLARKAANLTPVGRTANLVRSLAGGKNQGGPLGLGAKPTSGSEGTEDDKEREPGDNGSIDEQDKRQRADEIAKGEIKAWFSRKTILLLSIMVPIITAVLMFIVAIMAIINENKVAAFIVGKVIGDYSETDFDQNDYDDAKDELNEDKDLDKENDDSGTGPGDLALSDQSGNSVFPPEYFERISILGNNFTSLADCSGSDCEENPEFLYYLKVADIANRYKNKYNVDLDWYLLVATDIYNYDTVEEAIDANQGGYDKDTADDFNTLSKLDWDTDFRNIDEYSYLDAKDSTYDLAILAKNMVKKTTVQSCTNGNGRTLIDVEDEYLVSGGEQALNCKGYKFSSTYELDMDKYDDFLLEYIDKKFLGSSIGGNSMAEAMVNLALAQLQDPSKDGGLKYRQYMWGDYWDQWCAAFVSWVLGNTEYGGQKLSDIVKIKSAGVRSFMNYFYESDDPNIKFYFNDNCPKLRGKNGSGTYTPKPGDLIFIDWEATFTGEMPICDSCVMHQDHVGIVQRVEDGKIITIEGNRGGGRGKVMEDSYDLTSCVAIGFGSWYD